MKMKFLLASAVVCAVGSIFYLSQPDQVADFSPRGNSVSQDAAGAAEVLRKLRANVETGQVEATDVLKMKKAYKTIAKYAPKTVEMSWEQMGPNNIGGRTRAILAVDNNLIYAGSVSGGLWRSTDAGNNWEMIESFPGVPVSCIARTGDGTIFVGTGTSYDGGTGEGQSGFVGTGLYMSDDGENWDIVPGTLPTFLSNGADWSYIDELAADPNNPNKLWIAFNDGLAHYNTATSELYDPGDEGPLSGLSNSGCGDLQISRDGSLMLVAAGTRVYRSLDGGDTWSSISSGTDQTLLPQSSVGRIELAISPSDPDYAYALMAGTFGDLRGAFYSTDKGASWSQGWPGGIAEIDLFGSNRQGRYDNIITVDPNDPTRCLAGGVTLWEFGSDAQPEQIAFNFNFFGAGLYVHSDIHEFEWAPNGDLYIGTDGGIHKSTDGGQTFFTANRNYITTQFYGITYTPAGGAAGGTQDNGTWFVPFDGSLNDMQNGTEISGGDGFDCEISQVTEAPFGVIFSTSQNGVLYRFSEDGAGGSIYDEDILAIADADGDIGPFYTTIALYENTEDENSQQFIEVVNPFGQTVTSTPESPVVLSLTSINQSIPFNYTLPFGESLEFYDTIARPAFESPSLVTEDLNYFWIGAQALDSARNICQYDSTLLSIEQTIVGYEYQDTTVFFENVVIINGVEITVLDSSTFVIDSIPLYELDYIYDVVATCDSVYYYGADTLFNRPEHILVQDQYTSMLTIGFTGDQGVWLTRQGLNFNTSFADWWKIIPNLGSGQQTKALEFSADGNHLFVSTWQGRLYRVSGLNQLWANSEEQNDVDLSVLTVTQIFNTSGDAITGVASDPNDADHLVITIGGYGGNQKVRASVNATSASPTFTSIWNPPTYNGNELFGLPVYDAVIDVTNSDLIIVGTEFGMLATDDHGDTWTLVNNGDMDPTPVFDVRQQWKDWARFQYPSNRGVVYAGAHGRGLFRSSDIVSVKEPQGGAFDLKEQLLVYPNPANSIVQADINLKSSSDVRIEVYSITGKLVYSNVSNKLSSGTHTLRIPVSNLSVGNYVVRIEANGLNETAKFVISR